MNIALIGPSGAGKGTQAARLIAKFGLVHVATGDLFRRNLENHTALGILARKYMSQGELVPDEIVDAMIQETVRKTDSGKGILFDGFPRTRYQAVALDEFFVEVKRQLDAVIYLELGDSEIVKRLTGRLICCVCHTPYHVQFHPPTQTGVCDVCGGGLAPRDDDKPEMVGLRLKVFHRATDPLVNHYRKTNRLVVIDAGGDTETVSTAVIAALDALARGERVPEVRPAAKLIPEFEAPVALLPEQVARPSLDLVLLGGPGSGKGTQAEQLCNKLAIPHIATGDLFRENLKQQTDLGKLAKGYMDRGELVPDDVTEAMVEERLGRGDTGEGFVLDGFPRTLPQARALTEMMNKLRRRISGVLYLNVCDEDIVCRLSARLICRNCQTPYHRQFKPPQKPGVCDLCGGELYQRDDDNPTTVRARLKTFHGQTEPLIAYYKNAGLLTEVNGDGGVAVVTERTLGAVQELVAVK